MEYRLKNSSFSQLSDRKRKRYVKGDLVELTENQYKSFGDMFEPKDVQAQKVKAEKKANDEAKSKVEAHNKAKAEEAKKADADAKEKAKADADAKEKAKNN